MSANNVPIISIIPDDSEFTDQENDVNIEDLLTDTEDIYFTTEKRKKKPKKHVPPKRNPEATDIEDLDWSEDEQPLYIHENPIPIDQVLESEIPAIEEMYKVEDMKNKRRPKLRTQASTTTQNPQYLDTYEIDTNQALTDIEDMDASDEDDEASPDDVSDNELLREIIHDAGTIDISDRVRKFLKSHASPLFTPICTPVEGLSENEDDKTLGLNRHPCPIHHSSQLRPLSLSPQLSDLTDTEMLNYDSNDDLIKEGKHKQKHKRRSTPKTTKPSTDGSKGTIPKNSKKSLPSVLNETESEDDNDIIISKDKKKDKNSQFLNVQSHPDDGITDTEEIEGGNANSSEEEEVYPSADENNLVFSESYGSIDEKLCNKLKERPSSTPVETDEEEYQSENGDSGQEKDVDETEKFNINFVKKNKTVNVQKKKQIKTKKTGNALIPQSDTNEALTDIENLDSEEDDVEIPITVVVDEQELTDTESVEDTFEIQTPIEIQTPMEVPDIHIPSCSRNIIFEKQNDDNTYEIIVTPFDNSSENDSEMSSSIKFVHTDIEDMSGEEGDMPDFIPNNTFTFPLDANDGGVIEQKDSIKTEENIEVDDDTDIEDFKADQKSNLLQVANNESSKLTDCEDFDVSDSENLHLSVAQLRVIPSPTLNNAKTDVEDFEASDNEVERVYPDLSTTPDILRQMGGDTMCTKEGIGHFSKQDKKMLNERSDSIQFTQPGSPSPTLTDEIITSTEDEYYSRAETATPLQMDQQLDDASQFRVHSQNIQKVDFEADDEVMYLKGGGFITEGITDTEELGVSDEEYFSASENKMNVRVEGQRVNLSLKNNNLTVGWQQGQVKHNNEWGTSETKPAVGEKLGENGVRDAAHQESSGASTSGPVTGTLKDETTGEAKSDSENTQGTPQRNVSDQHQLSSEMMELLAEMEKHSKH